LRRKSKHKGGVV